jgi:acetylornithine deacetylase
MQPAIDRGYLVSALKRYVATNSVNPAFSGDNSNEARLARVVADDLASAGLDTRIISASPGRDSVVGTLSGEGTGKSLMLYAHLDTVAVAGVESTTDPIERAGRLYGRGAYDMKSGLASCVAVVRAIADAGVSLSGDIVVAGVADEEAASIGMEEVLKSVRTDAAVVTEPTELALCVAHKGFCWHRLTVRGRAAHGSRHEQGVDANLRMGAFLHELRHLEDTLRRHPAPHAYVGPPSLHVGVLQGGTGASTYADRCVAEIERRTIPGESPEDVTAELEEVLAAAQLATDDAASVELLLARPPFESSPDSDILGLLKRACQTEMGRQPAIAGRPEWMDSALLASAGIDTVVFGPGGDGAHAESEWVDLASLEQHARVLLAAALAYAR